MTIPVRPRGTGTLQYHDRLIDLVGQTPLLRLGGVALGVAPPVLVKLEYLNPGGSVKDRIALRMVSAAEVDGRLGQGGTIVEPTSGNTGVGLAIVAQLKKYRCVFTCPDKVSGDKLNVLRALGAEVVVCPATVPPDHPDSYRSVAARLSREIPGAVALDQYANLSNPLSHYEETGPEIWQQTGGRLTHLVAGIGTGGTVTGAGGYLKEVSDGAVRIIGVEPEGSVYAGGRHARPYLVEGVGQPVLPPVYDPAVPDEIVSVADRDSLLMTRRLAREEGLLVGPSCGMAVVAALQLASSLTPDDVVVTVLPDSGRGYLSKVFDDTWMARLGFIAPAAPGSQLAEVHAAIGRARHEPLFVRPHDPVSRALEMMSAHGVDRLPVVTAAEPPVRLLEVVGTVSARDLLAPLLAGGGDLATPVERHAGQRLPHAGTGQSIKDAMALMADSGAVLLLSDGMLRGVLTHQDLAAYLAITRPATATNQMGST